MTRHSLYLVQQNSLLNQETVLDLESDLPFDETAFFPTECIISLDNPPKNRVLLWHYSNICCVLNSLKRVYGVYLVSGPG